MGKKGGGTKTFIPYASKLVHGATEGQKALCSRLLKLWLYHA